LETEIHLLESRQTELTAELEKPATYQQPGRAMELNRELGGIQKSLLRLIPRWEEAATKLSALDSV
jgi:hypothetical protein